MKVGESLSVKWLDRGRQACLDHPTPQHTPDLLFQLHP